MLLKFFNYLLFVILQILEYHGPVLRQKPNGSWKSAETKTWQLNITSDVEVQRNTDQDSWDNYSAKLTDNVRGAWLEKRNLAVMHSFAVNSTVWHLVCLMNDWWKKLVIERHLICLLLHQFWLRLKKRVWHYKE